MPILGTLTFNSRSLSCGNADAVNLMKQKKSVTEHIDYGTFTAAVVFPAFSDIVSQNPSAFLREPFISPSILLPVLVSLRNVDVYITSYERLNHYC